MSVTPAGTVHSAHYQRFRTRPRTSRWVWVAMVERGVRLALKDHRNLILLMAAPGFIFGAVVIFYVLSLLEQLAGTRDAQGIYNFVKIFLRVDISGVAKLSDYRLPLWEGVFVLMTRLQLFYLLIVISRLGPGLIADDLKTNALPIYFARPITPMTYLLGKWLTIGVFIALCMLVPNMLALGGGILVAGTPGTWVQTFGLAGNLTLIGLGVMLIGGLLILALSSLTADKRFVVVAWIAIALLPEIIQQILFEELEGASTTRFLGSLSLNNNIMLLTNWVFDLRSAWQATGLPREAYEAALGRAVEPLYPALVLLAVTLTAGAIAYRRVVRFSQSAANL